MPLNDRDSKVLMTLRTDLHNNETLVMDLLPKLVGVFGESDINTTKYRANTDGYEWAANKLLTDYKKRANDLNPMANALRSVGMEELADKICSKLSERELKLLRNAQDVLQRDGDTVGLIEALRGRIFDQTDQQTILNEDSDGRMKKLIEIYKSKASSLLPLIDAFDSHTAQPHLARLLQNQ